MAYIQDITVNIVDGAKPMTQKGFGLPLILAPASTQGRQIWGFSKPVTKDSATGLANDNTKYTVKVKVNDINRTCEIQGDTAQTLEALINLMNDGGSGISGATVTFFPEGNGFIEIKSNKKGNGSAIEINVEEPSEKHLFKSLKNIEGKPGPSITVSEHLDVYTEYSESTSMTEHYNIGHPEYLMAAAMFDQTPCPKKVAVYTRSSGTITDALNKLKENHDGFYAVFISEREKVSLKEAGDWASSSKKFFFGCAGYGTDADALDGRNCDREAYIIHDKPHDYPECAWAGQNLPKVPGAITWKWKTLNNQKACEFSTTKLGTIRDKKGQAITEIGGLNVVNEGKTTAGQFIDVIRGKDWIKARMIENLYSLFVNNDKIPLDNTGIAQVEGVIRTVLKQAGNNGIIARATTEDELKKADDKEFMYSVSVPTREGISVADRANRILKNVEFVYYLAGAIHEAEVRGKITV
jgi:uncharacterized protein DUF3383